MSEPDWFMDFESEIQFEDLAYGDFTFENFEMENATAIENLNLEALDLDEPLSTYTQNSRVFHSNTGRGRGRAGWRGQNGNTNCRTMGGNSKDNQRNFSQESSNKKVITVPSHKVGRIIGKGGCKIRDLVFESGAKIKIGDSSGNETTVTLFGSPEATLKVEGMINKLIEDRTAVPRGCLSAKRNMIRVNKNNN